MPSPVTIEMGVVRVGSIAFDEASGRARHHSLSNGEQPWSLGGIRVTKSRAIFGSVRRFVSARALLLVMFVLLPATAAAAQGEASRKDTAAPATTATAAAGAKQDGLVGADAKDPAQVAAHLQRGDALYAAGSFQAARQEYEAALALCDPKHPQPVIAARLQSRLSKTLVMLGDYAKAQAVRRPGSRQLCQSSWRN